MADRKPSIARVCSLCDLGRLEVRQVADAGGDRVIEVVRCPLCDVARCGNQSCRAPLPTSPPAMSCERCGSVR